MLSNSQKSYTFSNLNIWIWCWFRPEYVQNLADMWPEDIWSPKLCPKFFACKTNNNSWFYAKKKIIFFIAGFFNRLLQKPLKKVLKKVKGIYLVRQIFTEKFFSRDHIFIINWPTIFILSAHQDRYTNLSRSIPISTGHA